MEHIPKVSFKKEEIPYRILGFEMVEFGSESLEKKPLDHDPTKPHRLGFYAILMFEGEEANHIVDFNICTLKKNDCLIISSGQIHAFDQLENYKGRLILFTEAFLQKYLAQASLTRISQLYNYFSGINQFKAPERANELVQFIQFEQATPHDSSPHIVGSLLSIFLLRLADEKKTQGFIGTPAELEIFNQFRQLLSENYKTNRNAKYYAEHQAISYKRLNDVCKTVLGKTAKNFIDDFVLLESKRLLISTTLSVKEICYELGFDEPTNFLKYFKKHTDLTPNEFRGLME